MAKAKFDYAKEDIIRGGDELIGASDEGNGLYVVMGRKFDIQAGGMSPWIALSPITEFVESNTEHWTDCVNKMRAGGIMCAANVKVNGWWVPDQEKYSGLGKYMVRGTVMEARSSHLLRGDGGTSKFTAPGAFDLFKAVQREVTEHLESRNQSGDGAAKDIAHDTATGTADPTPDNVNGTVIADAPAVPDGDTGSAHEVNQNATDTEPNTGEVVENGATGNKRSRRNRK